MSEGEAQHGLAALRTGYAARLPEKLQEIRDALARARDSDGDAAIREAARTLAHRLAGTAGSYGFFDVGEAAARIDRALGALTEGSALEPEWSMIDAALADALALVAI